MASKKKRANPKAAGKKPAPSGPNRPSRSWTAPTALTIESVGRSVSTLVDLAVCWAEANAAASASASDRSTREHKALLGAVRYADAYAEHAHAHARSAAAVWLVEEVASIYEDVATGRLTNARARSLLGRAHDQHPAARIVANDRVAFLRALAPPPPPRVLREGWATKVANQRVGRLLGRKVRTMYSWAKGTPGPPFGADPDERLRLNLALAVVFPDLDSSTLLDVVSREVEKLRRATSTTMTTQKKARRLASRTPWPSAAERKAFAQATTPAEKEAALDRLFVILDGGHPDVRAWTESRYGEDHHVDHRADDVDDEELKPARPLPKAIVDEKLIDPRRRRKPSSPAPNPAAWERVPRPENDGAGEPFVADGELALPTTSESVGRTLRPNDVDDSLPWDADVEAEYKRWRGRRDGPSPKSSRTPTSPAQKKGNTKPVRAR